MYQYCFVELKSLIYSTFDTNNCCHSRILNCLFLIKDWKCHSVSVECNLFRNLITNLL